MSLKALRPHALLLLCAAITASAQDKDQAWDGPAFQADAKAISTAAQAQPVDKFSAVTILLQEYRYEIDGSSRVTETVRNVYRVNSTQGVEGWGTTGARWEPWHQERPVVRARVIATDGNVLQLDQKTLTDAPARQASAEIFSDQRLYNAPLPGVAVGSVVEEEITVKDIEPSFAGGVSYRITLASTAPSLHTRVVIVHPLSLPLKSSVQEMAQANTRKETSGGSERITIENGRLEAFNEEWSNLPPEVFVYPTVEFSTGGSWAKVAERYAAAVQERIRPDEARAFAQIGPASGRMETIRKLVAKLHKNVRYTGIEFGEASLIPHTPSEVLGHKYGDCKDKAALLVSMLKANGINAHLALLDVGPGKDVDPEMPGIGGFDHAIVYVPASGADSELWIDATAEYFAVGLLPIQDYGRLAMIVDGSTTALAPTPSLKASGYRHVETREIYLSEFGPARVVETNQEFGPGDGDARQYLSSSSKESRKADEDYVKTTYMAEALTRSEALRAEDMEHPFTHVLEVAKAKRGWTGLDEATMYINPDDILGRLPNYFRQGEEDTEAQKNSEVKHMERRADWMLYPFLTEWHYKIHLPQGFVARALPEGRTHQLQSGVLAEQYSKGADGTIAADFSFTQEKARLTVADAKEMRKAVTEFKKQDAIVLRFRPLGTQLIEEVKVKEGLAEFRQAASGKSASAITLARYAQALLSVGLGERARIVARQAVKADAKSAIAASTLGWVLEHDLIGRRLELGFDRDGSIAAYQAAKQLDPDDQHNRVQLAVLYEYNKSARKNGEGAQISLGLKEWEELFSRKPETEHEYEDYPLFDLWHLDKQQELIKRIESLPLTATRRNLLFASIAVTSGAKEGIKRSEQVSSDEKQRASDLANSANLLLNRGSFVLAADYLEAARGNNNPNATQILAALRSAKPLADMEIKTDGSQPIDALYRLFLTTSKPDVTDEELASNLSRESTSVKHHKRDMDIFRRGFGSSYRTSPVPREPLLAILFASMKTSLDGDDQVGYRVTSQTINAAPIRFYMVKEDGKFRIMGINASMEDAGQEVLRRLELHDLPGARRWLDWSRDEIKLAGGDDPLTGHPFPRFWTKGQEGDENAIRRAAWALMARTEWIDPYLKTIAVARDNATGEERTRLDLVLVNAYQGNEHYAEMLPVALDLARTHPESDSIMAFVSAAYLHLQRAPEAVQFFEARTLKRPDDEEVSRLLAMAYMNAGEPGKARATLKKIVDSGKASNNDLNLFGWDALFAAEAVPADAVEAVERANSLTQSKNYAILHTLACLYADTGKLKQSRDLLEAALRANSLETPDSSLWYVAGRLAQLYGEEDAARAYYQRVEKGEETLAGSTFSLAAQHQKELSVVSTHSIASSVSGQSH